MHGPTFMGNPLACAVSLTSLEYLDEGAIAGVKKTLMGLLSDEDRTTPAAREPLEYLAVGVARQLVDQFEPHRNLERIEALGAPLRQLRRRDGRALRWSPHLHHRHRPPPARRSGSRWLRRGPRVS